MELINNWISCILAGVVLIGLIEVIVPEGEIKKFVFLITGVILSIIISTPIIKLFASDFSLDEIFDIDIPEESFYYIDTLRAAVDRQNEILEEVFSKNVVDKFNGMYKDMQIEECKILFSHDTDGKIIEIKEVAVKIRGKVQDTALLKSRVAEICEVDNEKVKVG